MMSMEREGMRYAVCDVLWASCSGAVAFVSAATFSGVDQALDGVGGFIFGGIVSGCDVGEVDVRWEVDGVLWKWWNLVDVDVVQIR